MALPEQDKQIPAWSAPENGAAGRWLRAELGSGAAALLGIAFFGLVAVASAAFGTPWIMIGIGGVGLGILRSYRRSGPALRHALWVASFFLLVAGLVVLPFLLISRL